MAPQIILLNGTSSSGKTTLARALQEETDLPYFHVCIDAFEDMMPSAVSASKYLGAALEAMYATISCLASTGNYLIVDHVLIEGEAPSNWIPGYLSATETFPALNVKVFAPLDVLRKREEARGDRNIGLAEWQSSRIHRTLRYHLEIDTSEVTPEQGAIAILKEIDAWRLASL